MDVSDEEELEDTGHDLQLDGETETSETGQVQQEMETGLAQVGAEMEVQEKAAVIDTEPVAVEVEGALPASDTEAVAAVAVAKRLVQQGEIDIETQAQQVQQHLPDGPAEAAVKRARPSLPGVSRPKVHASPDDILGPISPKPACIIRLSKTDHRWVCSWKPHIQSDRWIDELSNKSFSMVFDFRNEADWQEKLAKVHEYAWEKWKIGGGEENPALKLQDGKQPCEPGVIDPDVYNRLRPIVQAMPARKVYGR